jgi:uncharacterized protein YyaL (SSP411 family)
MANRLINETSPYLLQHAHNPVDWHAWGEEALGKAKAEGKPIFLSIGYAACHWCHVMERESFEDAATAEVMNRNFVSIKVDREERPDLDDIYMSAVVGLTGHGGWPMSVFLTPDGVPFYGGTYYPPTPRHGMPAFRQILEAVAEAWRERRDQVERQGGQVLEAIRRNELLGGALQGGDAGAPLDAQVATAAAHTLERSFDWENGGWGQAPKFPQPMALDFLLRYHAGTGNPQALKMAERTLQKMARGGIYDQLGGGFARYSTDEIWLVPHFEKMLYDNSQLARVYLHAYQVTGNAFYRRVVEEALDYVAREMTDPGGGFYSTQDADSEGEEGKFFVWRPDEIRAALSDDAPLFMEAYGVTERGNFEGKNILSAVLDLDVLAHRHRLSVAEVEQRLAAARAKLFAVREGRVKPGRDEKVLTAWNGLMLAAFAEAARALDRADYRQAAQRNADFLLRELRTPEGRLLRTWKEGRAHLNGYLEDYAYVIDGLLTLYESDFDARWFEAARALADTMIAHFEDPAGGFFDTSDDHEALVTRPKSVQDNAVPSGNALAALDLLRLGALTGEGRYTDLAEAALRLVQPLLARNPVFFAQWLSALDFAVSAPREVALIGDPAAADTRALLQVVYGPFRPHQVVALARPGEASPVPLLADRPALDGRATVYVCQNFACRMPVTEPAALEAQLKAGG